MICSIHNCEDALARAVARYRPAVRPNSVTTSRFYCPMCERPVKDGKCDCL